eukprot:CAMPEP_0196658228 /NCGR_PEP_ID=MMETSP1086-20130531/28242_1 /TAXON_ID=77921 /ORGANISM="Cyanoptyche  gloeocystis , Strain SAG4.97" /LENGTH=59 /DNA_ID=CAMNT_0041991703 /DNA_START=243 /DNA_END=422 /DNA_ORIENTATION=-
MKLAKLNVDDPENAEIASRYGVSSIPHILALRHGKVVDQFVGLIPDDRLSKFFQDVIEG